MEDGDEKEGRDEESKDVTESPGAMSSENSAAIENLMEAETEEGGEDIKLENLDNKRSGLESGESKETEINASQEENSEAGSKVEDGKSKNVVNIESQEPRAKRGRRKSKNRSDLLPRFPQSKNVVNIESQEPRVPFWNRNHPVEIRARRYFVWGL